MGGLRQDADTRRTYLSRALRSLRRRRGVSTAQMAAALGMKLRSYQHFEAGGSRANLERIHAVARALNADPYAILAAIDFGSPEFAVRTADNKLATIILLVMKEFDQAAADDIAQLDARVINSVFERAFAELAALAQERAAAARRRLEPPDPGETPR